MVTITTLPPETGFRLPSNPEMIRLAKIVLAAPSRPGEGRRARAEEGAWRGDMMSKSRPSRPWRQEFRNGGDAGRRERDSFRRIQFGVCFETRFGGARDV